MTTATDQLLPVANSMLPHGEGGLEDSDDEDAAGYEAMMSELPTIVSMSGLLDGDFDELNEIRNLLAVSDDDEEGHAAAAAAVAAEAAEEAYIQAMVPNPIPNGGFMTGMDVSATVAALDENLGFPSTSLVVTTGPPEAQSDTAGTSLSVRAPTKRVHKQLEAGLVTPAGPSILPPNPKKIKRESATHAQTPATLRTSLDGVSAPNPLLFGRPIKMPTQAKVDVTSPAKPKVALKPPKSPIKLKSALKLKNPLKVTTRAPQALPPPRKPLKAREPPKLRIAANPLTPEIISSYPVPACLASKTNTRPPLCKLFFKGKIDPAIGSTESAIARVPAPPLKLQSLPAGSAPAACTQNNSATASKKKASDKKKKAVKTKKKASAAKAKKVCTKPPPKTSPTEGTQKKSTVPKSNKTEGTTKAAPPKPALPKMEELMVANPLACLPPAAPARLLPPPPTKPTTAPTTALSSSPPCPLAVVSSNSSAASETPEDLAGTDAAKKTGGNNSKPHSAEEKAQACRDRNRQHARNTRLRKKAYVEELKHSLMDMVEERDRAAASREQEATKKEQSRVGRKRALQDFLRLRGHNEREEAKWALLMKDSKAFRLTLPATKFQATVNKVTSSDPEQVLVGVQDVMVDASYFASFLQSLGTTTKGPNEEIQNEISPVYLQYECDDSPLVMDGTTGFLYWKATTCGTVAQGAKSELRLNGTIRGAFCPDTDKLVSAKLMFDTGVIQAQLPRPPHV